jgi:parallel beta-helix repeat protein
MELTFNRGRDALMRKILLAGFFLFLASTSWATDILVPTDFPTIQQAIDAATATDRVVVGPGTWTENITMKDSVDVVSSDGAATTTIDSNGGDHTVDAQAVTATLTGFTITGGDSPTTGGGIRIWNSSDVTVEDCIVTGNNADGQGGGISIRDSQATVTGTTVTTNTADGGAGFFIEGAVAGDVTINSCTVSGNTATSVGGGFFVDNGDFTLTQSAVHGNTTAGLGGGIALDSSDPSISFCSIYLNTSADGGGISFHNQSAGTLESTTLYMNDGPIGGAVSCTNGSSPTITQTIMASSVSGGAMNCGQLSTPDVSCCLFWNNAGGDALCGNDGGSNQVADPEFCRTQPGVDGFFGLQEDSAAAAANSLCQLLIGEADVACGLSPVDTSTWGQIKNRYR